SLPCDGPWTTVGEKCYRLQTAKSSWNAHFITCYMIGGRLASVDSSETNAEITSTGGNDCFIGGAAFGPFGPAWVWADGRPFEYTNWREDSFAVPDAAKPCIRVDSSGYWIFTFRVMSNDSFFACPDGILRLGYVRNYYPTFYYDGIHRFRADRSAPPFDGSLGAIDRREIYTDVSTDDLDNLQWPQFKALQPIEFDTLQLPLDHFMVLSPLTLSLVVASYTIVNLLDYVSNYIRKGALAVLRDIWDFGALRQQLELGAMEWIAAEASEVDAPWLEAHPLFVEPDFRAKISRVCAASGSSVVSFFRSEWPEICRIEDIMATCSLNRYSLVTKGHIDD
ncbi:hypothetical protein PMAYCL1PPCAC_30520, partial [Pristionchus mayeri]